MADKTINGNVLVYLENQKTTLANGMSVQEQRGKKDVVSAKVALSSYEGIEPGDTVWFPYYAALPIVFKGEPMHVVNGGDVMVVESK